VYLSASLYLEDDHPLKLRLQQLLENSVNAHNSVVDADDWEQWVEPTREIEPATPWTHEALIEAGIENSEAKARGVREDLLPFMESGHLIRY
jgi:hypothetical protein